MNILIVDDEATALRDLSRVMRKTVPEAEIFTARDSDTALEVCKEKSIDVVFLDIQMPDMDGLTLAEKMKEIAPKNTSGDIPGNDVLSCTRSVLDINTRSGEKLAM